MVKCFFSDVSEHDMDMLFMEEFVCSESFLSLFTNKVGIINAKVVSVYSSKTDPYLGESDITVIVESDNERIGLLIENKIDAIAMPEQAARYSLRGEKGLDKGDYDRYFVFIIAPKKYLSENYEAKKYPNMVDYETVLAYFERMKDLRSEFKIQQIIHAIEKQKKGYQVDIDNDVTDFWREYSEYQKKHYPDILFMYRGEGKGSSATWIRINTVIPYLYMIHKTETGFVDLNFDGCAEKMVAIEGFLSDTIGDYLKKGFTVQRTGKSAAIRSLVPVLNMHVPFGEQIERIQTCFEAIKKTSDLVKSMDFNETQKFLQK